MLFLRSLCLFWEDLSVLSDAAPLSPSDVLVFIGPKPMTQGGGLALRHAHVLIFRGRGASDGSCQDWQNKVLLLLITSYNSYSFFSGMRNLFGGISCMMWNGGLVGR